MEKLNCPKGHGSMGYTAMQKDIAFRGVDLTIDADAYVCPVCGLEAGTMTTGGAVQRQIAEAYRMKTNFNLYER